ncbi:MAG: DMT family transporter [Patescibacteria group bacterium]|nr:DMT family transporter [Patescibacteria group bacterium]
MNIGLLFAFGALFGWAAGDFFIQRTVRVVGIVKSLFFIGFVGAFGLLPFVIDDIQTILPNYRNWPLLIILAAAVILAAFANFEGLKLGKLSIVLPLTGAELPVTILLSVFLGGERLPWFFYALMALAAFGIFLTMLTDFSHLKRLRLEKGVVYALLGAVGLGATNFLIGIGSRTTSPLFTIWFTHTAAMLVSLVILARESEARGLIRNIWHHPHIIFWQSFLDNAAWIFYAFSSAIIPISIASTISESYIAVGVMLGLAINKEKLKKHQLIGIALAFLGVVILSALVG